MSTTTAPVETVGFTVAAPTKEERIKKAFGKAMKKYNPPTPPLGGPSGWRPPGGGAGPVAGGGGQPAAPNQDVRPHRSPPATFHGDRALADNFLDELKLYFHLNWAVPAYQSYITRATFALTYIKGEQVAGWVQDFCTNFHTLAPPTNTELSVYHNISDPLS